MIENLLSIRILAHPNNKEWAEEMASRLDCSVVWRDGDDNWTNARRAWMELSEDGKEFSLLIQDNSILCDNFIEEVQKLIIRTYHYRTIYQLNVQDYQKKFNQKDISIGQDRNYLFSHELDDISAVIIPSRLIKDIVRYGNQSFYVGDEMKIKTFILRYTIPVTCPYPSLITK